MLSEPIISALLCPAFLTSYLIRNWFCPDIMDLQTSREADYGKPFSSEIWVAVGFIWKSSRAHLTSSISRVRWKMREREKLEWYLGVTAVSSNLA